MIHTIINKSVFSVGVGRKRNQSYENVVKANGPYSFCCVRDLRTELRSLLRSLVPSITDETTKIENNCYKNDR